ncbi:MAG: prolyl oligopeptidase family [Candidatus Nanosalina sp. J07AB43]|nr:MAG: prolyl oligopeptidase family [Candidatus Nanosalina sp. J07AB43]
MTQEYNVQVSEGEKISVAHHKVDSDKWIFFCHGFGSNKEGSYETRCNKATKAGFNAVRFDFRGNGESSGKFIEQTLSSRIKDLRSVVRYFSPDKYALFGSSFGGKTVIHSLTDLDPEAVFLKAPVLFNDTMKEYEDIVREKGSFTHHGEKTIDMKFVRDFQEYSFQDAAENMNCPLFIFHGGSDTTVEFAKTAEASKKLETDLEIIKLENEDHSFSKSAEKQMMEDIVTRLENSL